MGLLRRRRFIDSLAGRGAWLVLAALGPAVAFSGAAWAQTHAENAAALRTLQALRLQDGEAIRLDGRLEEAVWKRAVPATEFLQQEPREGAEPTERTEVYVVYDRDNLYVGAMLYDSEPEGILAYQRQRDASLYTDDRFMLILDTFLDGRTGYFFEINPAGLMGDGLVTGSGFGGFGGFGGRPGGGPGGGGGGMFGLNKSWDGVWEARVSRGPYGWSAEIRIPFRTLNFDPTRGTWGINFQRTVRRKQEELLWSGYRRNQGLFRPVHAGRLTGLNGISQGLGLEAKPYAMAAWRTVPEDANPTTFPRDVGLDLTYSITPGLRAALTVNTDFAEVEVDQRRVNLTRFPLYFPEKRDFFLEGSGVFSFAPGAAVTPYFSRQIGLVEGQAIPIVAGARLGGQAGAYELGFLQVRTGRYRELAPEDFTVARMKRRFLRESAVGAIYTRRTTQRLGDGTELPDRHTLGADLDLKTSRFLGDRNLQFEAFLVWHTDPEPSDASGFADRAAWGARLSYPNDVWRGYVSFRQLGERYDPAVGFVPRNGFRRVQPSITFAPRPRDSWIRQLQFQAELEYLTDLSNRLLTRSAELTFLGVRTQEGDFFELQGQQLFERLDKPFKIRGGITIPVGTYQTWEWTLRARSAGQRAVSGNVELARGGFWSGARTRYEAGVTVKPVPGINLDFQLERNEVELAQGAFTTHLLRLNGGWHMSPWASLGTNLQYDDVTDIVGLQARLRWIVRPGSDLYLVYTHNWQNLTDRLLDLELGTLSRQGTTKLSYTYRF